MDECTLDGAMKVDLRPEVNKDGRRGSWGILEVGRKVEEEKLSAELGSHYQLGIGRLLGVFPFDHQRSRVLPSPASAPRRQAFVGLTISTRKSSRKFHPCDGPNNRSLFFRVLPCLADFFGEFLQIQSWISRDESTFILVLRVMSFMASRQGREIS